MGNAHGVTSSVEYGVQFGMGDSTYVDQELGCADKMYLQVVEQIGNELHLCASLVWEIQHMLIKNWDVRIRCIYRETNIIADKLASMARSKELGLIVLDHPPEEVQRPLYEDVRGEGAICSCLV
ncbi:beta-glucosidase 12-like [Senna tora]|uniref:Beta-glucosidase 12-like n=1 Tax=Senna tora TaxID=362788 RepID=A0A834X941_9FABA|nr:beta-glucosidase 12-like [Senna tora]